MLTMMTMPKIEKTMHKTDDEFRAAARTAYPDLDIDTDAYVSTAPDGAFVEAWVWVPIDPVEQKEDS